MNAPLAHPGAGTVLRVAAFLLIVVVGLLWFGQQLDFGIVNTAAAGVGVLGVIGGLAGKLGKAAGYDLGKPVRPVLGWLVVHVAAPWFLWTAGPALALLMATRTSVTVVGEDGQDSVTILLAPLGAAPSPGRQASLGKGHPMARLGLLLTSPFGRAYQVAAEGYQAALVTLYPLVDRRVTLGEDLPPVASVLFRPFVNGLSALEDKAVFRVTRIRPDGPEPLAADTGRAAFRLGRARPLTEAMIEFWKLQLDASSAPPAERAKMLITWSAPRLLASSRTLASGDSLVAEIVLKDSVVARAGVRLAGERLVDVLVTDAGR